MFIDIKKSLPPFGKELLFRGVIDWKKDNNVSIFNDVLTMETEQLEYGETAYLLKNNTDYLVCQHSEVNTLCDQYITHWMPIPELNTVV
jgi:hypothetical protein